MDLAPYLAHVGHISVNVIVFAVVFVAVSVTIIEFKR